MGLMKYVESVGIDKVAHFGIGGLVCACTATICGGGWTGLAVGVAVAALSAWAKETVDSRFDWKDFAASVLGCLPVLAAVAVDCLINK